MGEAKSPKSRSCPQENSESHWVEERRAKMNARNKNSAVSSQPRRPSVPLPKGVWFQRKVLSSGEVIRYGYLGRGLGSEALGREGTAEFHRRLADVINRAPTAATVNTLIHRYKSSPEFTGLRDATRRDYTRQLAKIGEEFGPLSLNAMSSRYISEHLYRWRDGMASTPRQADYGVQVLKLLLSWGCSRGFLDHNRALGIGKLYESDRSEKVWSAEQMSAFAKDAPEPLVRAMILAAETGQRQEDLLRLGWTAVQGSVIQLRQLKGGRRATVPISDRLRACLHDIPRTDATTILTKQSGRPWEPKGNGFRSAWQDHAARVGIEDRHFHDLRGTFVTNRFGQGWTAQEIALCTGHSLRDLAILEKYTARSLVADASARALVASGRQ